MTRRTARGPALGMALDVESSSSAGTGWTWMSGKSSILRRVASAIAPEPTISVRSRGTRRRQR